MIVLLQKLPRLCRRCLTILQKVKNPPGEGWKSVIRGLMQIVRRKGGPVRVQVAGSVPGREFVGERVTQSWN